MKRTTLYQIGFGLFASVGLFIIINRAMKKKMLKQIYDELEGIVGDREKKRIEKIMNGTLSAKLSDAFNPLFYRTIATKQKGNPITRELAREKAKQIHTAWGTFDQDEEKNYGAFRSLPTKAAVSFVAFWYNKEYKSDLFSDINYKLSDDEKKTVFNIVQQKVSL